MAMSTCFTKRNKSEKAEPLFMDKHGYKTIDFYNTLKEADKLGAKNLISVFNDLHETTKRDYLEFSFLAESVFKIFSEYVKDDNRAVILSAYNSIKTACEQYANGELTEEELNHYRGKIQEYTD